MIPKFIKSPDSGYGEAELLDKLSSNLKQSKKVLWIVSGGSNVGIACRVMAKLDDDLTSNLRLLLSDERYGPEGHNDSNYQQLLDGGFNNKLANFEPILNDKLDLGQTVERYKELLSSSLEWSDVVIGQLGIGEDGHIAGILPDSPVINSEAQVVYYEVVPYKRLSLSLEALKHIDWLYVFCFGPNKIDALTRLREGKESLSSLPSLILSSIQHVTVYNDRIEGAK